VHNAAFEQADAQIHPFPEASFDLALGRTAAMFFGDKPAAFANLAHALRPGGQLALLVWQPASRNEWFTAFMTALAASRDLPQPPPDGPNPFSMADPETVRGLLATAGFIAVRFENVVEPMRFGAHADDAHPFVLGLLGWMLHGLDETDRRAAEESLRLTLEQHQSDAGVHYGSAAWLITARRGTQVPSATR
jgi:SAM-dependent methyltransferase